MTVPVQPSPALAPGQAERAAAIAALLAPVPLIPVPVSPQWIDTRVRGVDPKSLY